MSGTWIWFPDEFEYMLYRKIMHRRTYRNSIVIPSWRIDGLFPSIYFKKSFTLEENAEVEIIGCGDLSVYLDGMFNLVKLQDNKLNISKGSHEIIVELFNPLGLPCVLINGGGIDSNNTWQVKNWSSEWVFAESREFADKDYTPNDYRLPVRKKAYVDKSGVDGGNLYDFGEELMAYTVIENVKGSGTISLYYGETLSEAADCAHSETCDYITFIDGIQITTSNMVYAIDKPIKTDVGAGNAMTTGTKAFRYINVHAEGVSFDDICVLEEYRPVEQKGYFRCSDDTINKVCEVCYRTLVLNSREFYLDGIKRDRWVWSGDIYNCLYYNYMTYFDPEITESSIIALLGKDRPKHHINHILSYSFYIIMSISEHYRYTGRKEFVQKIYDKAVWLLEFCEKELNDSGYIETQPGSWAFVDWADMDNEGQCALHQILYIEALNCMSVLGKLINDDRNEDYEKKSKLLSHKFFEEFWQDDEKCFAHTIYTDGVKNERLTKYAEIFAIKFDLLDNHKLAHAYNKIRDDKTQKIITPYMMYHELDAIGKGGYVKDMVKAIKDYWGAMVNAGADCVWEEFDPKNPNSMGMVSLGHKYGNSKCHAWGAGPLSLLPQYVAGIKPMKKGYSDGYEIKPDYEVLDMWEAVVPTPYGNIEASWKNNILTVFADGIDGVLKLEVPVLSQDGQSLCLYKDNVYVYKLSKNIRHTFLINGMSAVLGNNYGLIQKIV